MRYTLFGIRADRDVHSPRARRLDAMPHTHRRACVSSAPRTLLALGAACLAAALAAPAPALAADVWTQPNPGVRHLQRSSATAGEFHALVIDLDAPGVHIRCTPQLERWQTTSSYGRHAHLAAAINGGFWGRDGLGAQGLAAGGGLIWSSDDAEMGFFAVGDDGRAFISRASDVVSAGRRGITDAVSGRPLILDHGRISEEIWSFPHALERQPRSAAGVSQDGRTVFLVTVDGRRNASTGATLIEMAELLIELGAYQALNLDGGGSTTMFVANEGGVVNRPSDRRERNVVNHIGVAAPGTQE